MLYKRERDIRGTELALTRRTFEVTNFGITDATERRNWREKIEDLSDGRNTVIFNDTDIPSVMVRIPAINQDELSTTNFNPASQLHPAFVVGGSNKDELLIGKYPGVLLNDSTKDCLVSLRGVDPANNKDFDQFHTYAGANNGAGWHLMTNIEWALLSLWQYANDWEARGNTARGINHTRTDERGNPAMNEDASDVGRTLTGSGPRSWSHDGSPFGVFDLVGNVWEWVAGMRLDGGEIQVIADNDAADNSVDVTGTGPWEAILQDGSLVAPGTADTLKYDAGALADNSNIELDTTIDNQQSGGDDANNRYKDIQLATGVSVPDILRLACLYPHETDMSNGHTWVRNYDERLPRRGGAWGNGGNAGAFALALNYGRSDDARNLGARPAFVSL